MTGIFKLRQGRFCGFNKHFSHGSQCNLFTKLYHAQYKRLKWIVGFLIIYHSSFAQERPEINLVFPKLFATYEFIGHLSDNAPDCKCKKLFGKSTFNSPNYRELLARFDTLRIHEAIIYEEYPVGQKTPCMTASILERNLIQSGDMTGFKNLSFGIVPSSELSALSEILERFLPVYENLIYQPNESKFRNQHRQLIEFVNQSNLETYFQQGLDFYNSSWDPSIPVNIAVIPSIHEKGFKARAFMNNAVLEVPMDFSENEILFSVLMHEIYHVVYNEQSLEFKNLIATWFSENHSENSQYAYLLLNEALATALGNGYVYEQLTGTTDRSDWYSIPFINDMAKKMYPLVKEYMQNKGPMDDDFIDRYIRIFDGHFASLLKDLNFILSHRFVLSDDEQAARFLRTQFRYAGMDKSIHPFSMNGLEQLKQTRITKVIIVSSGHEAKLNTIRSEFNELIDWDFDAGKDFAHSVALSDKTRMIVINHVSKSLEDIFSEYFPGNRIK